MLGRWGPAAAPSSDGAGRFRRRQGRGAGGADGAAAVRWCGRPAGSRPAGGLTRNSQRRRASLSCFGTSGCCCFLALREGALDSRFPPLAQPLFQALRTPKGRIEQPPLPAQCRIPCPLPPGIGAAMQPRREARPGHARSAGKEHIHPTSPSRPGRPGRPIRPSQSGSCRRLARGLGRRLAFGSREAVPGLWALSPKV